MQRFDPDLAIFAALSAKITGEPTETVFTYMNPVAMELFGERLLGMNVIELLTEIIGDELEARAAFSRELNGEAIVVEGKLGGRDVQYHSMADLSNRHIQAAIMDTTESRRAVEGFIYTAGALARAAEVNDAGTGHHIVRINSYAGRLAGLLGQDEHFIENITLLAQLHDVGKIHTPPEILKKKGLLTSEEFEIMKEHTGAGARIIGDHPRLTIARQIALAHHEKWDGSGYPGGVSGEAIPLSARIVTVVDCFDALVSERPYKPPFDYKETYRILREGDERIDPDCQYDPRVWKTFMDNYDIFVDIHSGLKG